jgi:hypothetical protein
MLALPVTNPNVQDCGSPAAYAITGRGNTRMLRPTDPEAVDEFLALRDQTPCNELVADRMRLGTWSIASFFVLASVGAALGLIDDRVSFRRAPKFEGLLRERPADAPGAIWDQPVVPRQDIGQRLPEIESSDIGAFVVWSAATIVMLFVVSGWSATVSELTDPRLLPLLVVVLFAVAARVVAGAELLVVEAGLLDRRSRLDRSVAIMAACDFAGRLRPAFGTIGVQSHALVRRGIPRDRALLETGVMCLLAVTAHGAVTAVLLLLALATGPGDGSWPPYEVLLLLAVLATAIAGLTVLPARLHRLPCTLSRRTIDRIRERWQAAHGDVARIVALACALPLLHGVVLAACVATFTSDVSAVPLLFVAAVGTAFAAFAPTPDGLVGADAVLVLGLTLSGVGAIPAVAAVLLWRLAMTWLPLVSGYVLTRRLTADGTL